MTKPSIDPKIGEILSEYVSYGPLRRDDQFDEAFEDLRAISRSMVDKPMVVWRVVSIDPVQAAALKEGLAIDLRPRRFGSWTKDFKAVLPLLRGRSTGNDDGVLIVVGKWLEPGAWALDVAKVYEKLRWNTPDMQEWSLYVEWENEMLVEQNDSLLRISPEEVVSFHSTNDPDVLMPRIGERVWSEDIGRMVDIEAILQDDSAQVDGRHAIEAEGHRMFIEWNRRLHSWDAVAVPAPTP